MSKTPHVVFVCLHGSAKSVIADAHFQSLVRTRGLNLRSAAAGTEPDAALPPHVVVGLRQDGLDVTGIRPQAAADATLGKATHVVSFGPDVGQWVPDGCQVTYWKDVPTVADSYDSARSEILRRVSGLVDALMASQGEST
jgi:protein-tyrosine-phosphatase